MSGEFRIQSNGDESNEDKNIFYRNAQIQKLFADYFYDKDRIKSSKEEPPNDDKKAILPEINSGSTGTTKFTTVVTHLN